MKRGICFLASVFFHAILFFILVHFYPPVRILLFEPEVRNVIIVPPEKLFRPDLAKGLPDVLDTDYFLLRKRLKRDSITSESERPVERGEPGEGSVSNPTESPLNPGLISGFRLDTPLESTQESPGSKKLNFSLTVNEKSIPRKDRGKSAGEIDLLRYVFPGLPVRYSGTRNVPGRGRVSVYTKDYDITPWAEMVVKLILNHWLIPSSQEIKEKELVKVSITVYKDGKIAPVNIISPSQKESVNQAVLEAIRLSSPFPQLPEDFPYEALEIYIVFQANE